MIGRFKYGDEIFYGEVKDGKVVVDRGLYSDTFLLSDVQILPPTMPGKIICAGLNYRDHADELNMRIPETPIIFLKPSSAIISSNANIIYPDSTKHVDYEAELAVIIGKRCRNIKAEDVNSVIMGYTCFNDVTARDLQKLDGQWTRSKSFDTFAPIGPYIAEPELDIRDLSIRTRVNGKLRQDSRTSHLIFRIPELIEFISGVMTLEHDDVIATGTPAGVGELHVGDEVEIDIEKIGVLKNTVVAQE